MATRLDVASSAAATTLAYSVSAGGNRCLVVGVQTEGTQSGNFTCDYGGQTMAHLVQTIAGSGTTQQTVGLFFLNDAGIEAASGTTITPGNTGTPGDLTIHARSYEDCVQTTPTNTDSDSSAAATPNPLAALDIVTSNANAIVCALSGMGNVGGASWASPLTEQTDQADASSQASFADDEVPTGTTIACECTWTGPNRMAAVAVGIEHASAEGISSVSPSEFDFDNTDVDIIGSNFEASQGSGAVYISDASTLAGSVNEVEIDGAINTWADALINLDFSGMSQTEVDNLHTLGPNATRYIIVTNNSADEYSSQITLHRPHGIQMVAGALVPGTTTSRLTGMTGTFAGGRGEETAAQNPSTTPTNVADDGNRQDLWSIEAKTGSREVTYDFRVLYGGVVADTITQTPQLTVSDSGQEITGTVGAIASGEAHETDHALVAATPQAITGAVGGIASGEAFETDSALSQPTQGITGTVGEIASAEAFEVDAFIDSEDLITVDNGVATGEAFEVDNAIAAATPQAITGTVGAIASAEAFATDHILVGVAQDISGTAGAIASAEAFETDAIISVPFLPITDAGAIASTEAFEADNALAAATPQPISIAAGIATAEAFETDSIVVAATPQAITGTVGAIASAEAFEVDTALSQPAQGVTVVNGIATAEAFEVDAALVSTLKTIAPAAGIASSEAFEVDAVLAIPVANTIAVDNGIVSGEVFGNMIIASEGTGSAANQRAGLRKGTIHIGV